MTGLSRWLCRSLLLVHAWAPLHAQTSRAPALPVLTPTAAVEKLLDPAKEFNVIVFAPSGWIFTPVLKRWETALDNYTRLNVKVIIPDSDEEAKSYGLRVYTTVLYYRRGTLARVDETFFSNVNGRPKMVIYVDEYLAPVLKELGGPYVRLPGEHDWMYANRERLVREVAAILESEKLKELERRLSAPPAVILEPGQGLTAEETFRLPWADEPGSQSQ